MAGGVIGDGWRLSMRLRWRERAPRILPGPLGALGVPSPITHHQIEESKREDPKMMMCVRDYDESMIGTHTPKDDFRMCKIVMCEKTEPEPVRVQKEEIRGVDDES